jgi:hypothetical protein
MLNNEIHNKEELSKSQFSNKLLKTFDDHMSKTKEKLEQNIQEKGNIDKLEKELRDDIDNLSNLLNSIIIRHHKDYVSSFTNFMNIVRKDLQMKLEQMEKVEEERRRKNNINIITCERDYFRMESIRMHDLCKKLQEQLNDVTIKMNLLKDEVIILQNKWRDSQNEKRQIVIDLEKNSLTAKELEKSINQLREILNKEQKKIINEKIEKKDNKEQLINLIDKYKKDLEKEKIKNNKVLNELVQMKQERNKLENIFIDCVEETRKMIFNRRLKKSFERKNSRNKLSDSEINRSLNFDYNNFLMVDKKQIIEDFILNDDVNSFIKEVMFLKNNNKNGNLIENKNLINKIKLPSIHGSFIQKKMQKSESTKNLVNKQSFIKKLKIINK